MYVHTYLGTERSSMISKRKIFTPSAQQHIYIYQPRLNWDRHHKVKIYSHRVKCDNIVNSKEGAIIKSKHVYCCVIWNR